MWNFLQLLFQAAMENIFISLKSADQTPAKYANENVYAQDAQDAQKITVAKAGYTIVTETKNGTKTSGWCLETVNSWGGKKSKCFFKTENKLAET